MAGAIIGSYVSIDENCIINSGSIISHDSTIKKSSHITPGAILAGNVNYWKKMYYWNGINDIFRTRNFR